MVTSVLSTQYSLRWMMHFAWVYSVARHWRKQSGGLQIWDGLADSELECPTGDLRHHQIGQVILFPEVEYLDDVWMRK